MRKAYVGLSGGVDSAVSASLLKERGYAVTGVFIKIWSPEFIECTWRDDRLDAMRIAVHLGIPFKEIDLSREYRSVIIERMIGDYRRGITPNPDVLCNSIIKFGSFYDWARKDGADIVATGHYARIAERDGFMHLLRGKDSSKDQSYFIYQLTQKHLKHIAFPVGDMRKSDVREYAARKALPVAKKPDSQGLCFAGEISLHEFLSKFITLEKGAVLNRKNEVIGEHDGAALYTLGQRHGFRTSGGESRAPMFVVSIDVGRNKILVSPDKADAERTSIEIQDISWTRDQRSSPFQVRVQTRYRTEAVEATISQTSEGLQAEFSRAHLATPGQAAVLYEDDDVIGGGTIV